MASRDNQLNQPPDPALISCPFCAREFKSLGNHLPKCKERHDRDYSSYLSKKTLDRKAKTGSSRRSCPKCHKKFLRLDTHLKNNPFCKSIETPQISPQNSPCNIQDQPMPSNNPDNPDEPTSCSLSEPTPATSDLPNTSTKNELLPGYHWNFLPLKKIGCKLTPSLVTSLSHSVCLQVVLMKRTESLLMESMTTLHRNMVPRNRINQSVRGEGRSTTGLWRQ